MGLTSGLYEVRGCNDHMLKRMVRSLTWEVGPVKLKTPTGTLVVDVTCIKTVGSGTLEITAQGYFAPQGKFHLKEQERVFQGTFFTREGVLSFYVASTPPSSTRATGLHPSLRALLEEAIRAGNTGPDGNPVISIVRKEG